MKCIAVIVPVLLLVLMKNVKALQVDTMDTPKSVITLYAPSAGFLSSGILKSHNGVSYTPHRSKTLNVLAPFGYRLMVSIRYIDLRPNNQDVLTLSSASTLPRTYSNSGSGRRKRKYPLEEETYYVPYGNLSVTFVTGPNSYTYGYDGFELIYTVQASGSQCRPYDFFCGNGRCIASALQCDDHNHCGDGSSLSNCFYPASRPGKVVGIVFGCFFVLVAVVCGIYAVCRRRGYRTETRTVITSHPPPPINQPSYPPMYPCPPPPYTQGVTNPTYH